MLDFFVEGGWGMWPTLALGLVMLGSAAKYSNEPHPARLRFLAAVGITLTVAMTHAMLTGVAATLWYVQDPERAPDAQFWRVLATGLKESSRAGAMGGAFLVLALVLVCVGLYREGRGTRG